MRHYPPTNAGVIELKGDIDPTGDDPNELVTKALDDLRATVDERLKPIETKAADLDKIGDRLGKIEARLNRPGIIGLKDAAPAEIERKAFVSMCRRGPERLDPIETKALTVANDTSAGFLAPAEIASEILKQLVQWSPIRQYARVVSISASSVKYPKQTAGTTATWVDETEERPESEPSYQQIEISPFEMATTVPVSNALLEDNTYNLEGELTADLAERFGKAEGTAFVKGTGTVQPKGIMAATGIPEIKTGAAAAFPATNPADVLIGMYHALPGPHAQNGVWLMNRTTLGVIRTWKDTTGRYLCTEPITAGAPVTLLGRPIVEAIDMDDIEANKFPILFGDLSGYRIVDRVSLAIMRDPYTLAKKGQVLFHARKRVGADVTHTDRFVKLKVAA